ncbi:MAG: thioredoxin [Ruminococcaceae bacterium]|jgi:thioredoxin 1|nr:thioredoxin [Oscillospiraceae bacterium]
MAAQDIFQFSDSNFQNIVLRSKIPVLVEFWIPDGGPCRSMAPIFEELAGEYKDKVMFGRINAYDCPGLCAEFRINSVPVLLLLEDGITQHKYVGLRSKEQIKGMIDKYFSQKKEAEQDE